MIPINYWAVIAAAVASFAIGGLWYGPVFGKRWMVLVGFTPEKVEAEKNKGIAKSYLLMFVGSLVMAYVLANSLIFASPYLAVAGVLGLAAGCLTGFWSWLGFIAPVTMGSVLWEGKSWKLWILNNGYYLVSLCVMGMLLAAWK